MLENHPLNCVILPIFFPVQAASIQGWVFLERTRILSGIQFTTHFIDFFVVETKRFVGSTVNVILARQTCGQRSSRAAESKRRPGARKLFFRANFPYVPDIKL